jgi:hypothetical protein
MMGLGRRLSRHDSRNQGDAAEEWAILVAAMSNIISAGIIDGGKKVPAITDRLLVLVAHLIATSLMTEPTGTRSGCYLTFDFGDIN